MQLCCIVYGGLNTNDTEIITVILLNFIFEFFLGSFLITIVIIIIIIYVSTFNYKSMYIGKFLKIFSTVIRTIK